MEKPQRELIANDPSTNLHDFCRMADNSLIFVKAELLSIMLATLCPKF